MTKINNIMEEVKARNLTCSELRCLANRVEEQGQAVQKREEAARDADFLKSIGRLAIDLVELGATEGQTCCVLDRSVQLHALDSGEDAQSLPARLQRRCADGG